MNKAKWEDNGNGIKWCGACGKPASFDAKNGFYLSPFCPNCGAQMNNAEKKFTGSQIVVMREYYNAGYLFIARDSSDGPLPGNVYVSDVMPKKEHGIWKSGGNICKVPRKMFPQLTWDDEEATRFTDYINVEDAQ